MFPVSTSFLKIDDELKSFLDSASISVPENIRDPYQWSVSKSNEYHERIAYIAERIENFFYGLFSSGLFCDYCGSPDGKVIPGFLHDGTGVNTWMYTDPRTAGVICRSCNSHSGGLKVNYRTRPIELKGFSRKNIMSMDPEIVLPSIENTLNHFVYRDDGVLVPLTERADNTISRFALNRVDLVLRRAKHIEARKGLDINKYYWSDLDGFHNRESLSTPIDMVFAMFAVDYEKGYIKDKFVERLSGIISGVSSQYASYLNILDLDEIYQYGRRMALDDGVSKWNYSKESFSGVGSITFSGVRKFRGRQEVKFSGRNSLIFIGENGVGKSSFLELASCLIEPGNKRYLKGLYNKRDPFEAKISYVNYDSELRYDERFSRRGKRESCNLISISERRLMKLNVKRLCRDISLSSYSGEVFSWYGKTIKLLLDIPQSYSLIMDAGTVFWESPSVSDDRIYMEDMSSGYTSILNIMYSITSKLLKPKRDPDFKAFRAALTNTVVLIDEIELHLHPRFKKNIVKNLQAAFPEVVFVITTHDPLVIKSAGENTDIILIKEVDGKSEVISDLPDHKHMTTEQILTSPFFGLGTTRSGEEAQRKLDEYYSSIRSENWERAAQLRRELGEHGLFGQTYRELVALSLVDAYLAKSKVPVPEDIYKALDAVEGKYEEN